VTTLGPELTCKEVVELVTDYLEGALPDIERQRFDEHLDGCPFCRVYLEQMHQTVRMLGRLPEEGIAPEAISALLEQFQRWR
jgi:predicted anti-sigma-YlaC factor YlaD